MADVTAKVTVYTIRFGDYCVAAKQLLTSKSVAYNEINVDSDLAMRRDDPEWPSYRTPNLGG
ncbi:MAG: glutaredoxin 3 [Porticoccus sp.]|jgi:glutaredoxin 3